jgi:hypothetical protein
MKITKSLLPILLSALLSSCETATPDGGAGSFRLSDEDRARHQAREAAREQERLDQMAQPGGGGTVVYQQNERGLFGSRSSTGRVQATGPIQSYQTIGNTPLQPGMIVPGNNYPAPSVNGGPGTYIDARTGQLMYRR